MDNFLVVKVKYGDTLRRFNAAVNMDQRLDLDLSQLRAKICSLFNFNPDANFTLTYIDEDDDSVTLAEDEDLYDVMRQGLDPLRLTVTLITDRSAQSSAVASEGSAPNITSSQNLHQGINPGVAEVLKSVPEPLLDALSKLSLDLASRAATTSPVVAQLVDNLSALGQAFRNAPVSESTVAGVSTPDGVCNHAAGSSGSKKPEPANKSKANGIEVSQTTPESTPSSVPVEVAGHAEPARHTGLPVFLNNKGKFTNFGLGGQVKNCGSKNDKDIADDSAGKSGFMKNDTNLVNDVTSRDQLKEVFCKKKTIQEAGGDKKGFYYGKRPTRTNLYDYVGGECPFSGSPIQRTHRPLIHELRLPFDNLKYTAGMCPTVHKGVCCDGCGILPICGARFKSTVKHDYDLCNFCFSQMGSSSDYIRIDFPGQYKIPSSRPSVEKTRRSKLDSCFIMDVNVMDGTLMAPSTPFTKIWRMRNNGPFPWVRGLRLVWIQGDRFSTSNSVDIEIPVGGVNVGGQIDIAVDFVAPETPGRYMSHWRMAEQSGLQFGQRVWVDIKVDASLNLTSESASGLNLNLPPVVPTAVPVNVEPVLGHEAGNLDCASEIDKRSVVNQKRKIEIEDLNFPINNDLIDEVIRDRRMSSSRLDAASSPAPSVMSSAPPLPPVGGGSPAHSVESSVSYHEADASAKLSTIAASCPEIDKSSEAFITSIGFAASMVKDPQRNPESDVEESLLMELQEMGFKEVELNKEVLRMNAYDLERSVDELCGANEWDPILEELQEMGFHDKDTNRKLLAKNNGSIMRVVMDLISGEKA